MKGFWICSREPREQETAVEIQAFKIEKPDDINFLLGQTHFIKSVENNHEAFFTAVPGIKLGLAFCEASGKCLIRWSGTDPAMTGLFRHKKRPSLVRRETGRRRAVFLHRCPNLLDAGAAALGQFQFLQ